MATGDIKVPQDNGSDEFVPKTIAVTGAGTMKFHTDKAPTFVAAAAAIADLPAFTDPPTAGEMATLRTTVNSMLAALRANNTILT
jgi:hypothetical protein